MEGSNPLHFSLNYTHMKNSTIAIVALVLFIVWAIVTIALTVNPPVEWNKEEQSIAQYGSLFLTCVSLSVMIAFGGKSDDNDGGE